MDFEIGAEKEEVLEQYINHFWDARENVVPGKKEDYFFHLVDRKEDPVRDILTLADGSKVPFTVMNYFIQHEKTVTVAGLPTN